MKRSVFKALGAIFLASAIVLTQLPPSASNASGVSDNNGFMMDGNKLVKYTGTATSVSVPAGVKSIGAEAFADCAGISYVTFPDSLEQIENGAFSGCQSLNRIIIPKNCKSIGNGAFADCENLSSVSLPASLTELGTSVFAGCTDLKTITVESGNANFVCEDGVLYNDDKTAIYQVLAGREKTTYVMPNSVEEIKKYAFWGCDNLKEVGLSSALTEIGDYAFSNASGLISLTLPYSVRSIGTKAFEDCRNLSEVTIPVSVTKIDSTAFDGCYQLHITADEGTVAADFYAAFENSQASQDEYEDSVSANSNPHWTADEESGEDGEKEQASRYEASNVDNYVEWDVDSPGVLGRTKVVSKRAVVFMDADAARVYGGETTSENSAANGGAEAASGKAQTAEADDANGQDVVKDHKICNKAFYLDESLLSYTIPSDVEEIGDFAFARSGLTSIRIPSGVTTIGTGAFYHCDDLLAVSIPATVTEIAPDAFAHSAWLENWYSGADVSDFLVVGDGILLAYKGTAANVTLPSNVRSVAPGVFADHEEITQVTLPDSVRVIGEGAFEGCSSLTNIAGGGSLTEIRDRAFYECPIETVRIPASVESVGLAAFGGTGKTDSVVFLGTALPQMSYEQSATRLTGNRTGCFSDIGTAVVPDKVTANDLEGTVLDGEKLGLQGSVYTLDETNAKAEALAVTGFLDTEDEAAALPDTISVYGKQYQVQATDQTAYPKQKETVSDNSIQGLLVVDHDSLRDADIQLTANASTVDLDGYHFYLSNPGSGEGELTEQIEAYYGTVTDENCFLMDLSLYDSTDQIPIKKLGKNPITVTMPVPAELLDDEICVVSLDENGNPEITFCTWQEKDGKQYISFDVTHFSPYALYGAEGELKNQITQKRSAATYAAGLDNTPDTGDTLDIRLILVIGLASLGGFLLLLGFRRTSEKLST